MPSKPEDVMRIVYNATLYEVSWSTPASSSAPASTSVTAFVKNRLRKPQISHFTVFWCRTIRDNPVVCLVTRSHFASVFSLFSVRYHPEGFFNCTWSSISNVMTGSFSN